MSVNEILLKHGDLGKFVVKIMTEFISKGKGDEPDKSRGLLKDPDVAQALIENDKDFDDLETQKVVVVTDGNTAYTIGETRLLLNEAEMVAIIMGAVKNKMSDAEKSVVFKKKEKSK